MSCTFSLFNVGFRKRCRTHSANMIAWLPQTERSWFGTFVTRLPKRLFRGVRGLRGMAFPREARLRVPLKQPGQL